MEHRTYRITISYVSNISSSLNYPPRPIQLGHTAVDVNLIAYGPEIEKLRGNHDNTEIGLFIADVLKLDLPTVSEKLNDKKNEDWLVNVVGRDKVEDGVHSKRGLAGRGCGCGVDHHLL